jgi:hypothetical protein
VELNGIEWCRVVKSGVKWCKVPGHKFHSFSNFLSKKIKMVLAYKGAALSAAILSFYI